MRRYDSYKDSGIEWIGEIPNSWNFNKVGNNTYVKGRIGWKGLRSEDFIDEGPFLITGTDFNKDGSINWDNTYHVDQERYDEDPFIQLQDHDVLITKDGTIGKVVYVGNLKGPTCLNSGIFLTRPTKEEYISKYFFWLLNSNIFKVFVDYNSGGSTIQHLYQNVFVNFRFPIPPLSEQQQIVSFLDTKTTLIDSLIEKTYRKIELLKENRTSLIKEVVTKGLNPNVEMKDSGVEWIGEIPSHWTIPKLSFYCEVKDGTHSTPTYVDEGYPLVTQKDITKGKLDFSKTKNISKEDYDEINKRSNVVYGDIIMSMIGSIGNPTIVDTKIPFSIKNVCLFKTSESNELTNFVHYFLTSSVLMTELELKSRGGVQGFVSLDVLRNISFIRPPLSEQQQIVSYLDEQTQLIDKTISVEERRIDTLKEYRQSLISEVVTGKRKVVN